MRVIYFDCFSGISGDMTVGALVDLGVNHQVIEEELRKLNLEDEYALSWEKMTKKGITGTKLHVILKNQEDHPHSDFHEHEHGHYDPHHGRSQNHIYSHDNIHEDSHELTHNHGHHADQGHGHTNHRHYKQIVKLIKESELADSVKDMSLRIFKKIAIAEGKVHNLPIEEVHFHEVGAVDSIIDIVATAIAINELNPDKIMASAIPTGSGTIKIDHGIYPVPAPATLHLLRNVPIQSTDLKSELTTPTGAGIIATLVDEFDTLPSMIVKEIGYGAGTKDFPNHPNVLRVILGDIQ